MCLDRAFRTLQTAGNHFDRQFMVVVFFYEWTESFRVTGLCAFNQIFFVKS